MSKKADTFEYRKRSMEQWRKRCDLPLRGVNSRPLPDWACGKSGETAETPKYEKPVTGFLQENILALLCFDTEACPTIIASVDPRNYESVVYRTIAERATAYFRKYKKAPGEGHLPDLLEDYLTSSRRADVRMYSDALHDLHTLFSGGTGVNREYVLSQLHEFVRAGIFRRTILEATDTFKTGDLDKAIRKLLEGGKRAGNPQSQGLLAGLLTDYELRKLEVPPVVDAIYPIIQLPGITFMSGAFGSAKTLFALKCAMAIVSSQDFFNYHVGKPLSVAFMDFELPVATLKRRRKMVRQTFGGKIDTSRLTYWSAAKCHADGEPIANFVDQGQIPGQLEKYDKYDVLFIDNLSHAMRGVDMNIAESYDAMHDFTMQRKFAGKSTVIIQHLGKDNSKGPRGSSRQEDWPDVSLMLSKTINANRNAVIEVGCRKMRNHGESAFEPINIELGNEDGRFAMHHRTLVESKSEKIKEEYQQMLEDDLIKRGTQTELAEKYKVDKGLVSKLVSKVIRKAKV